MFYISLDADYIIDLHSCDFSLFIQNKIERIENLECLSSSLKFLMLAGNNITTVDGLDLLKVLSFLDLSDNMIDQLECEKLPKTLIFVTFNGNKCCQQTDYR